MRSLWAIVILCLITSRTPAASSPPPNSGGSESIGNKLMEGLTPSVPQPISPATNAPASQPPAAAQAPPAVSPIVPLAHIQQGMQSAQSLLAAPDAASRPGTVQLARSAQKNVVSQLDQLIAQLSKQCQCQGGQCDKPPSPNSAAKPK